MTDAEKGITIYDKVDRKAAKRNAVKDASGELIQATVS